MKCDCNYIYSENNDIKRGWKFYENELRKNLKDLTTRL